MSVSKWLSVAQQWKKLYRLIIFWCICVQLVYSLLCILLSLISADINECAANTDECDHTCINNIGSYECQCRTGFQLSNDAHSCIG